MEIGKVGAYSFDREDGKSPEIEEEYYIVEFKSVPYIHDVTKEWLVDCYYFNYVPFARHWYTKSKEFTTVKMVNVVATDLEIKPFSKQNPIPRIVRRDAESKNATRLTDECHYFILDEISRRERLEFDPSKVVSGTRPDIESDDEEEDNL